MFRKLCTFVLALISLAVAAGYPVAAQVLYVADDARQLLTYNVDTNTFTPVGSPMPAVIGGMGCADPTPTLLYGTDALNPVGIYAIDPGTAMATLLDRVPGHTAVGSTVGPDGTVWAISTGSSGLLYTVDPASLDVTDIGNTGFPNEGQPAFDTNGNLYTFRVGQPSDILYQLDPATADATAIGDVGFRVFAAAFCGDTLYGFTPDHNVITIDTSTGMGTVIATYGPPVTGSIQAAACCPGDGTK